MHQKSFFEFLSLSHQERIHSQIISWIFSNNFKGIKESEKIKLLNSIFKLNIEQVEFAITEYKNIDILVKTNDSILVIENKLKSSQHSNQLDKYLKICKEDFPHLNQKFYFLTLIGEKSNDKNWENISYENLYENLKTLKLIDNNHSTIFKEYLTFLTKLVSIFKDFSENYFNYKTVFLDGKKKKIDKIYYDYPSLNEEFIGKNQLETIFQKCLLNKIANHFNYEVSNVTDTRGEALIDFIFQTVKYKKKEYNIFMQLQFDNIKFAIASKNYNESNKKSIEPIIDIFEKLKAENNFGYRKLNKPKEKAYVSISKKMSPNNYWEIEFDSLIKILEKEINSSKKLAIQLKEIIEKYVA